MCWPLYLPPVCFTCVCWVCGWDNRAWIRNTRTPQKPSWMHSRNDGTLTFSPQLWPQTEPQITHVWVCSVWKLRSTETSEPLGVEYGPRVALAPVTLGENCYIINMTRTRPRIKSIVGICHSISEGTQQLLGKLKDENPISPQNSPWIGQNASRLPGKRKTNRLCGTYRTSSGPRLACHCCPDSMPYL